jgi:hypothetical protein
VEEPLNEPPDRIKISRRSFDLGRTDLLVLERRSMLHFHFPGGKYREI